MELTKITKLLIDSGCSLEDDATDQYYSCLSYMNRWTKDYDINAKIIKNYLSSSRFSELEKFIIDIRVMLLGSHLFDLARNCDVIIDNIDKKRYIICEALIGDLSQKLYKVSARFIESKSKIKDMDYDLNLFTSNKVNINDLDKQNPLEKSDKTNEGEYIKNIKKKVILAVDDSPEILNSISGILSKDYDFFGVSSYKAALRFLDNRTPDLFIFDIEMPGMNGFELASTIDIKKSQKPLIFLTSNAFGHNVKEAVGVGATDFIAKPCDSNMLLSKVQKSLGSN